MPQHRMPSGRWTGRKPDRHDIRDGDYAYRAGTHLKLMGPAPSKVDVCAGLAMPPIFDQGQEGSCTANAGIRFRIWLALRFPQYSPSPVELSRAAQYYWERALPWNDDIEEDSGASSRDIYVVLSKIGACPEADDPYSYSTLTTNPGDKAIQDASAWRIGSFHRIPSCDDLKALLMQGFAATIGFTVYPSLDEVGADGIWNPDPSKERSCGGHETFIRGYDDSVNGGSYRSDNSWTGDWGDRGSFWIPYKFLENYSASQWDCWTAAPKYDQAVKS
jgi:Papain family cysteine protease